MAAITPVTSPNSEFIVLRSVSAQATTGQTDWLYPPQWAKYALVYLNVTAVAGTTPILTPSFLAADPVSKDDTFVVNVAEHTALTGITAAAQYVFQLGPGVTGIADDVTNAAAADSYVSLNVVLPMLLGVKILNDRTSADETYTYNLSIHYRS